MERVIVNSGVTVSFITPQSYVKVVVFPFFVVLATSPYSVGTYVVMMHHGIKPSPVQSKSGDESAPMVSDSTNPVPEWIDQLRTKGSPPSARVSLLAMPTKLFVGAGCCELKYVRVVRRSTTGELMLRSSCIVTLPKAS